MKTAVTIACIAMVSFAVGVRSLASRVEAKEELVVTLEQRITTLERNMKACCSTNTLGLYEARSDLEVMVRLRKKVDELEARVEELER